MRHIKITISSIFILFALIIITVGYYLWQGDSHKNEDGIYRTTKAYLGNVVETVTANGNLNPVTLVSVGAQVSGKVQKIHVDFNDHVKAGQILLELDATLLQAQVAASLAGVSKAQATLDLARANAKRGELLYSKRAITKQDWEQLQHMLKAANAELEAAQAKLQGGRANLNYATIRSPVSGVVVNRQVDVGQTVTATFQTPVLFQIAQDLSKMQIDTSFAEADVGKIAPNQTATFTVDAFPQRNFSGIVQQIRLTPTIQQNVVTYNVVVKVDNPDGILLPGMTAYVTTKTAERKNVLLIPNSAIRFKPKDVSTPVVAQSASSDSKIIYTLADNKLNPINCKLGISDNSYTEIFATPLKVDDEVITGYTPRDDDSASAVRLRML